MWLKYVFTLCSLIIVLSENVVFTRGKTAPEFSVTYSSKNFVQIHIPLTMWNNLVKRSASAKISYKLKSELSDKNKLLAKKKVSTKQNALSQSNAATTPPELLLTDNKPVNEITLEIYSPDSISDAVQVITEVETSSDAVENIAEETIDSGVKPTLQIANTVDKPPLEGSVASDSIVAPAVEEVIQESPIVAAAPVIPEEVSVDPVMVVVNSSRAPCSCAMAKCTCCVTVISQKGCANVKFLPEEFAFEMDMTMNGDLVTRRKLPINDPPPLCFNPRRAPFMELCAQINNIHFKKQNVHMCIDIDANIGGFDLFSWNYNCLKFGNQGLLSGLNPDKVTRKPIPGLNLGGNDDDDGGFFGLFGDGDDDDGGVLDLFDGDDY